MMALKIAIDLLVVFTALGLACAVWIALPPRHRQGDPFDPPIGDVMGFSREQLDHFARRSRCQMRRDPLNRSLDFSPSAGVPQRTATGGRSMPFGAFARRNIPPPPPTTIEKAGFPRIFGWLP